MKKVVILYSGGLDSFILHKLAIKLNLKPNCIYFDIGQDYAWKEIQVLPNFVEIRKVDWLKNEQLSAKSGSESGNIFIPGRNMVLASLAASIYLPQEIWLGALLGETHEASTDKNYSFLDKANNLFRYVYSPFQVSPEIKFPLADLGFGKFEAIQWALNNGCSENELLNTSSCLTGSTKNPCGICVVCARRWGIFYQLMKNNDNFENNPPESKENFPMFLEMLKENNSHYDEYRKREIVPALLKYYNVTNINDLKKKMI